MKERPLLFSAPMVRAILDGRKTQTRRVISPQPESAQMIGSNQASLCYPGMIWRESPYGRPGDRLWVRETWRDVCPMRGNKCCCTQEKKAKDHRPIFKADDLERFWPKCNSPSNPLKWRSSRYMPRWASRITLEITAVRVQRVREISAADIIAEGAVTRPYYDEHLGKCPVSAFDGKCYVDLRSLFASGWQGINAKRGFGWDKNPWVWALTFRRI